jgi:hypothetical protein
MVRELTWQFRQREILVTKLLGLVIGQGTGQVCHKVVNCLLNAVALAPAQPQRNRRRRWHCVTPMD